MEDPGLHQCDWETGFDLRDPSRKDPDFES